MKKGILLFTIAVTGIITAMAVVQLRSAGGEDLLKANTEALAGTGVIIPCKLSPGDSCSYTVWVEDAEGKLVEAGIQTYKNMRSTKDEQN